MSVGWVSGSIYKPLVGHAICFFVKADSQIVCKIARFQGACSLLTQERNDMLQGKVAIAIMNVGELSDT